MSRKVQHVMQRNSRWPFPHSRRPGQIGNRLKASPKRLGFAPGIDQSWKLLVHGRARLGSATISAGSSGKEHSIVCLPPNSSRSFEPTDG
jgi:hypothetical protein